MSKQKIQVELIHMGKSYFSDLIPADENKFNSVDDQIFKAVKNGVVSLDSQGNTYTFGKNIVDNSIVILHRIND